MITAVGKDIIARFLAGQLPAAFSHVAIGVGATPTTSSTEDPALSTKTLLDFEALRVPISNASVLKEAGKTRLSFTATLPAEDRYEFSEVGVYSAESNSLLTTARDQIITTFSDAEGWADQSGVDIGTDHFASGVDLIIANSSAATASFVKSDDPAFLYPDRGLQRARLGSDCLILKGGYSTISGTAYDPVTNLTGFTTSGAHVKLSGTTVDLSTARPDDELKFAFSVADRTYTSAKSVIPDPIDISLQFLSGDATQVASLEYTVPASTLGTNGYVVASKKIKDLKYTSTFSWSAVSQIRLYAKMRAGVGTPNNFWIIADAVRFDSKNQNNPTYGLVSYSLVSNAQQATQVKSTNLESVIEYKINLEVS
jgi:hypothetical protein